MTDKPTVATDSKPAMSAGSMANAQGAPALASSYRMQPTKASIPDNIKTDPTAYSNYLFGSSGSFEKPAWSDSTSGRAWIRVISRGVVGSIFFALGGHFAAKAMKGYEPELWRFRGEGVSQTISKIASNPLQAIAKVVDMGPGKLINKVAGDKAVRFRPYSRFHGHAEFADSMHEQLVVQRKLPAEIVQKLTEKYEFGRSLGNEVVQVSNDFFWGSVGDAATRNIIQAFDPNIKQSWILDKDGNATTRGHGKTDFGKLLQHIGKSAWRVFSYNAMEDWAVALPYVYYMKWQRQAISNIGNDPNSWAARHGLRGKGFERSSDSNINGAMVLLDENGMRKGSYGWAGALDLHGRFVVYNWFTLMYRETYDKIGQFFKDWTNNAPASTATHSNNIISSAVATVTDTVRYVARSFIKANLYMNPAMLFFWPMRVGQSAWRGTNETRLANGEFKTVRISDPNPKVDGLPFPRVDLINADKKLIEIAAKVNDGGVAKPFGVNPSNSPNFFKNSSNPHDFSIARTPLNHMFNALGAASFTLGSWATNAVKVIAPNPGRITQSLMKGTSSEGNLLLGREKLIRNTVDSALSYGPYMWAKAETALRVNDTPGNGKPGPMDNAIDGLLNNTFSFKFADAWKSVKQVAKLAVVEEKPLRSREGGFDISEAPKKPSTTVSDIARNPAPEKPTKPTATVAANSIHRVTEPQKKSYVADTIPALELAHSR